MTSDSRLAIRHPAILGWRCAIENAVRTRVRCSHLLRTIRQGCTSLLVAALSASAAQMTLTWQDNSTNEDGFKIERSTGGGGFTQVGVTGANITTYVDAGVTAGATYTYRVCAYNSAGSSAFSSTATATVPAAANAAPSLGTLAPVSINANASSGPIAFTVADAETPAGSLTVSGSSSNTGLVPNAGIVFGGSGANRTVTITPASNQSGTATITVGVSDGVNTSTGTFVVTVRAVNTAPSISDIANRTVNAGTGTGAIPFTIGDAQTATAGLVVTASSSNQNLVPAANITLGGSGANRTISIQPAGNLSGVATLTVTVSDGALSASDSFVLTVMAPNTAPTISGIANRTVGSGVSTGPIGFAIGDAQTAASLLTVTAGSTNTTLVPLANIALGGTGSSRTITVQPAANQSGTATLTVTVSDGALTASDSFILTVTPPNTAPTITAIPNATIDANTATAPLAFTIGDAETAVSELILSAQSSNPSLVPLANIAFGGSGSNRTVSVVPTADQSGTATITVRVTDGTLISSRGFVLTVRPVNTAPTLTPVASRTIEANASTGALSFTVGDAESPASSLVVSASSSNSALVPVSGLLLSGSGANRTIVVTPTANQVGATTITVTASDGALTSAMTFVVTVTAVATAPTISEIADVSVDVNGTTPAIAFTISHATTPAAALLVTTSSSDASLVPPGGIVLGGSEGNRTITVQPAAQKVGSATVTIVVSDGTLSASESFRLTVNAVNSAPTISAITDRTISTNRSTGAIAFQVGDSATPAGNLLVTANSSDPALVPASGIVIGGSGSNRTIIVTPAQERSGVAVITVSVSDGLLAASTSFNVRVLGVNQVPTIDNVENQTIAAGTTSGAIPVVVADADTPAANLVLTANSSNLALLPLSGIGIGGTGTVRSLTLTPAATMMGSATVTLTVSDGFASSSTSFVLTVTGQNNAPSISPVGNITITAGQSSELMSFTIGDGETPVDALSVTANSSNPSLVPEGGIQLGGSGAARSVRIFPATGMTGTAAVTLTVSDGGANASTSFVVTVTPSSSAPTISLLSDQSLPVGGSTGAIPFVVGDDVVSPAMLTVTANSSNLHLVPLSSITLGGSGENRTVSITPAGGASGSSTITLSVSNGTLTTSTSFVLTVNVPNTAPTITGVPAQTLEMDATSGPIAFTVGDAQTPAGNLIVTGTVSNGALISPAGLSFNGVDAARTVTLTPITGKTGSATITLTVSDGTLTSSTTFAVDVRPRNLPPTITSITNRSMTTGNTSAAVEFVVGDAITPVDGLAVSATSSNPALVPVAGVVFGGSGANRWLKVTPVDGQTGTTTITVMVSDGQLSTSTSFVLTVMAPNSVPTLSDLPNRSTMVGRASGAHEFTIGDLETPAGSLTVTGISSNQALLANHNIVFGGTGEVRTFTVTPSSNQTGAVTVTLTVSDGILTTSKSFVLTITAVSTAPRISDIANVTTAMNGNVGVSFTVTDNETAAGSLTVTATSQNTLLVPAQNIAFGGSGANRTAIITPSTDRTGTAVITFRVSDGTLSSTVSFALVVTAPGKVPTVSRIYNRAIDANTSTGSIPFVISDQDTPATKVTVTAKSSHPSLIPDANIVLNGTAENRTVQITPAQNQSGNAMITLTASDGAYASSTSFFVTVYAINVAPRISGLANRTVVANGVPEVIGFTVSDPDTPVANLTVTAASSNQILLPGATIVVSGTAADRTMTLSPSPGQIGSTTVVVTVSDGNLSSSGSFVLTVNDEGAGQPSAGKPGEPNSSGDGNGPVIEQPGQADILVVRQPADVTIRPGRSATLDVSVIAAGAVSYQWYLGGRGNLDQPVPGATSAVFATPPLNATASYWVRIYNATQSAMSQAAIVTVAGDRYTYFGTVGATGPSSGAFALLVNSDNTGLFLADSPALSQGISVRGFTVAADGTFAFEAPGVGTVSGVLNGTTVTGVIGFSRVPFSGSIEAVGGGAAAMTGLYQGALVNTPDGGFIALAGSSGRAFVALSTGGVSHGAEGTLSNDGVLVASLRDGRVVGLDVEGGVVSGTVSGAGVTHEVRGLRDTVVSTTKVNNMSIRAQAGSGAGTLTAGFTVVGTGSKKLLLRATGPGLLPFGVTGVLADPMLTVFRQGNGADVTTLGQNNDWSADTANLAQSLGAFPLPAGSKDAAMVVDLPAGGYTAQVAGADGSTGATLVEIYDGDTAGATDSRLTNISLRGNAGSGENVIVTGFIVTGNAPRRMLIRAVGPELAGYGVEGSLADPQLSLFQTKEGATTEIAANDDWSGNGATISQVGGQVGAFPLTAGSKSSALVLWLAPGTYTAHTRSAGNTTGIVIVEVYEVP